jgi:DNA-binding NarL/FixJ family response regulator
MDLDLSFLDAVALVVLVAGALIAGRALPTRLALPLAAGGAVVFTLLVGSAVGAVLAVAVLGLSTAAGVLIKERAEDTPAPRSPSRSPDPSHGAWTNPDELTPREVEVLELIAAGNSNQDIADQLHISMATVKTHVNRVFAKTGVRDRAQAVVYAYDRGLTAAPPQG